MKITVDDFFLPNNTVAPLPDELYAKSALFIAAAKAFARSTHQCVYLIDYSRKGFVYVSDNLALLCGQPAGQIRDFGYELYLRHVPGKELEMLSEINEKGFELFDTIPVDQRTEYSIQYDFHLTAGRKARLVHHTLTPLALTRDGKIWLALCTISMSSRNTPGHAVFKKEHSKEYFLYDLARHQWIKKEETVLSEMEHSVLWLSTQGYTMNEIAGRLFRSVDTVKACKRSLFARLGVKNIAEALWHAANYRLL